MCCGRRFGKTELGKRLLEPAYTQNVPIGWFAPTVKDSLEVWTQIKYAFHPVIAKVSEQHKRLDLIGGGIIEFWSLDDPSSGRGRKYWRVIIDEAAKAKKLEEAWQQTIRPTLTDLIGNAVFLSTPKGMNYFHDLFQMKEKDPELWERWQLPTTTNPYIDPEEVESASRELPALIYSQEYLAEFVAGAGFVFNDAVYYDTLPEAPYREAHGFDAAYTTKTSSDYTVTLTGRLIDKKIYITNMIRAQLEPLQYIPMMKANNVNRVTWIRSGTEKGLEQLLISQGISVNAITASTDKLSRAMNAATAWNRGDILLPKNATFMPMIESEISSFTGFDDAHDDIVDALAALHHALIGTETQVFL